MKVSRRRKHASVWEEDRINGCLVSRRKTRESREALLKEGRKEVYSSSRGKR